MTARRGADGDVHYALAMLFFTPLPLLLSVMSGASGQAGLVPDRLLNTVLGAAGGVLVAFLIPTGRPLARP